MPFCDRLCANFLFPYDFFSMHPVPIGRHDGYPGFTGHQPSPEFDGRLRTGSQFRCLFSVSEIYPVSPYFDPVTPVAP